MLAPRIPYSGHRGDTTRGYDIARSLGQAHEVMLACLAESNADRVRVDALAEIVGRVEFARVFMPRTRRKGFVALTCLLLQSAVRNQPNSARTPA